MDLTSIKRKIEWFFGFEFKNFSSFENFVSFMYEPRNPSSLGVMRILFGLLMVMDTLFERNGLHILYRWGNSDDCHFPLFPQMKPPNFFMIAIIYGIMFAGAIGIMLGYKFRLSTISFGIPYWYLLLLDKTYWNNHSYLFGLVAILLIGSSANHSFSIDSLFNTKLKNAPVPFWNYFILRFQFFILYFMAGLKKIDMEWLFGYSMNDMGDHWVFQPFKLVLSTEQIDYIVIHLIGLIIDLTIGFWLLSPILRSYAMCFCTSFHFMNSRLFSIGMFPYVCIATTPIFCNDDWPENFQRKFKFRFSPTVSNKYKEKNVKMNWKQHTVTKFLLLYCCVQFLLPYSHSITKGFNNWTNGLYGYSWDMMVHSWNTALVVIRIVDNDSKKEYFMDPEVWTQNQRWNKHADMCLQYAQCLQKNLNQIREESFTESLSNNISIYIDVWCSLNGRFQQRMFNPNYDLLKANWSPFTKVEWLLPLMVESSEFRNKLPEIENHIYSWSKYSEVMFVADFPGMLLENYLPTDLVNVTLTVLSGKVIYETENCEQTSPTYVQLVEGSYHDIATGYFHKIHTNGIQPSLYMYTFINQTKEKLEDMD
ncbi:hypothetical protein RI129_004557 [Pyrocoelia pectoralis]|uniref:HTTM-like domain-containing protein n=1 Tax=Pyrocoelia pectoralis TaxID=417401 RepID=A0AAN7VH62_9COLE